MKLRDYLKKKDRELFANKIKTTKNYVDQLCAFQRRPSPELALKIEKATGGQVNRMELLYPDTATDPVNPGLEDSGQFK